MCNLHTTEYSTNSAMNFKALLITAWIWFPAFATAYDTDSERFLLCDSPVCIERAKLLNESLNTSIDPCTDFYSYVCSGWESTHPLPSGRGSYDIYKEIGEDIPKKLSYIIGNRTLVESNQTVIDKVAIMYNACLALPDTPDALIRVLNGSGYNAWPILAEQNSFDSSNCIDLLRHINISAILNVHPIYMKQYSDDPGYLYQMNVGPMPVQEEIKKLKDIEGVIKNTIKFLNPGIDSLMLENLTSQLVEFARNLSYLLDYSKSHTPYNISSLEAKFGSKIPISDLLTKEFKKVNITLNDTDTFHVFDIYIDKLIIFLDTANPNTFYNYAGLLAMFPYIKYVSMNTEQATSNALTPSTTKGRSWGECIAMLHESTSDILDYLYVNSDTTHTAIKNEVADISWRLKQAFSETLQNNSWIDDRTREALEKKLNKVILGIGYPDTLLNISVLETQYKYVPFFDLNISFTEALYYFRENSYKMHLRKVRYPEEGDLSWEHSSRDSRTFHDNYWPKSEIPYALFVSPFFEQGLPRSLNYGGIGVTIAHELVHTFGYEGIDFCYGRKCQKPMTRNYFALFENRTSCFGEKYKAVNEKLLRELSGEYATLEPTLDEDLADNTGLQTAFNAYTKLFREECAGLDTRLTGLKNITGMQLFFISYARTMCKIADKDTLINEIKWSGYSTARYRVNEAMKNSREFAKAFSCSPGSPMRPNETCSLW